MSEEEKKKEETPQAPEEKVRPQEERAPAEKDGKENPQKKLEEEIHSLKIQIDNLNVDVANAKKEAADWKNKYYLAYADMANTRKEVQRETEDFKKYAKQSVIEEFIPVLDSFDMALKNEPDDPVIGKYLEGFKMIHGKLLTALVQMGIEIIDPKQGEEFDPHRMNAFSAVDGEEDNKVYETFLKGYRLHDHLLRPAGVIITKKAEKKEVEKKEEAPKADEKAQEKKDN